MKNKLLRYFRNQYRKDCLKVIRKLKNKYKNYKFTLEENYNLESYQIIVNDKYIFTLELDFNCKNIDLLLKNGLENTDEDCKVCFEENNDNINIYCKKCNNYTCSDCFIQMFNTDCITGLKCPFCRYSYDFFLEEEDESNLYSKFLLLKNKKIQNSLNPNQTIFLPVDFFILFLNNLTLEVSLL